MDGVVGSAAEQVAGELAASTGVTASALLDENLRCFAAYYQEVEDDWVLGRISSPSVARESWRRALKAFDVTDPALVDHAGTRFRAAAAERQRLFDDALPFLEAVRGRFGLAIITNGASDLQREKLRLTGIEGLFDCVMVSGEHGIAKPDARIFSMALDGLGVAADEAWHIGDNLIADVGGAQAAGVVAVWLNRHGAVRREDHAVPDLEVRSLAELASVLGISA